MGAQRAMGTEYYTVPSIPFATAKSLLESNNEGWTVEARENRMIPEGLPAFYVSKGGVGIWLLSEYLPRKLEEGVVSVVGSAYFEMYAHAYQIIPDVMPWLERVLGVRVFDEMGLEWDGYLGYATVES